jgi:hypothetical protein
MNAINRDNASIFGNFTFLSLFSEELDSLPTIEKRMAFEFSHFIEDNPQIKGNTFKFSPDDLALPDYSDCTIKTIEELENAAQLLLDRGKIKFHFEFGEFKTPIITKLISYKDKGHIEFSTPSKWKGLLSGKISACEVCKK